MELHHRGPELAIRGPPFCPTENGFLGRVGAPRPRHSRPGKGRRWHPPWLPCVEGYQLFRGVHMARNGRPTWPILRQLREGDVKGLGHTAASPRSLSLKPRTVTADKMVQSVCPYCAVGCGQQVYVKDGKILDI